MLARTFSVVAGFDLTMESAAQVRSPLYSPACPVSVRHGEENRYPGTLPCVVAGSSARASQLQGPLVSRAGQRGSFAGSVFWHVPGGVHPSPQRAAWILSIVTGRPKSPGTYLHLRAAVNTRARQRLREQLR